MIEATSKKVIQADYVYTIECTVFMSVVCNTYHFFEHLRGIIINKDKKLNEKLE